MPTLLLDGASARDDSARDDGARAISRLALEADSNARLALEHPLVARTRFASTSFVAPDGARRPGLAATLARRLPVPTHRRAACLQCRRAAPTGTAVVLSTRARARAASAPNVAAARCHTRDGALAHGSLVDAQLVEFVRDEAAFYARYGLAEADACVYAFVRYVREVRHWEFVAAQLPLSVPSLGVATAIDIVCTDAATRRELYVLELKASANEPAGWSVYEHAHSAYRRSGALGRVPRSRYSLHQLQLWGMWHGLSADAHLEVDGAYVVRVSPTAITAFPLHPWFRTQDAALARFWARTVMKSRRRRRRR